MRHDLHLQVLQEREGVHLPAGPTLHVMQTLACRTKMEGELAAGFLNAPASNRIPSLSTSSIPLSDDFAMDINDADVTDHANDFTPTGKADLEHDHCAAAPPPSRRATVEDV